MCESREIVSVSVEPGTPDGHVSPHDLKPPNPWKTLQEPPKSLEPQTLDILRTWILYALSVPEVICRTEALA